MIGSHGTHVNKRAEQGPCFTFPCLFRCTVLHFWCSTLKLKVTCKTYWQETNKKGESMSNGGKKSSGNIFEEGLVILGGLLWADVSFDVRVRPQELQPPLMLPARYFCQYSLYRARHPMWCSCPWLKSTVVSGKEQSGQKPQTITFAGSPFKILKSSTVLYFQFWSVQRQNAYFPSISQTFKHLTLLLC